MTRPCRWPDGGCGAEIIDVLTIKGAKQVLDAQPVKRIILGSTATTHTPNDSVVVMLGPDPEPLPQVAVVVDTYVDHHATCSAFARKVERERAAKAGAS